MISRSAKSEAHLEEAAIVDTLRTFIAVQGRDWVRRQQNAILPRVLNLVDDARARGDRPDVPALIRQVWLEQEIPRPALETGS